MGLPEIPIGHANDARETAERRLRRSSEVRVIRELAAVRRYRRVQRIASRLGLHRTARLAARAAARHKLRTYSGKASPISSEEHVNWMW